MSNAKGTENSQDRPFESRGTPRARGFAGCCGGDTADWAEMMEHCPISSWKKGGRRIFLGALTTGGLLFVIAVSGWVLGVLAFFRTF